MSEQRTEAWFKERCGKVTASRIADVCAKTKSGYGASRANYMAQLIVERLTGNPQNSYQNDAMRFGIEHEDEARAAYEFYTGNTVTQCGFIPHPSIPMAGASPDGLVGPHGLVEIKVPNTATHIATLLSSEIAMNYYLQIQWQLACTERRWCDFVSFDPRLPPKLQFYRFHVKRHKKTIEEITKEINYLQSDIDVKIRQLEDYYNGL